MTELRQEDRCRDVKNSRKVNTPLEASLIQRKERFILETEPLHKHSKSLKFLRHMHEKMMARLAAEAELLASALSFAPRPSLILVGRGNVDLELMIINSF